jgi:hypothetical protein
VVLIPVGTACGAAHRPRCLSDPSAEREAVPLRHSRVETVSRIGSEDQHVPVKKGPAQFDFSGPFSGGSLIRPFCKGAGSPPYYEIGDRIGVVRTGPIF